MNETVAGEKGMVVAPHRAAAEAGAEILREGGNAVEATVAAAATIAVVYPHMNSIGGDGFWLIAEPGRPPRAIDACGAAGALATRDRYETKGYDRIPSRGPDAALTVAGTVSGWAMALEAAALLGGRMPRRDLLTDAIRRARDGTTVTRSEAWALRDNFRTLSAIGPFAAHFLPGGKLPEIGAHRTQAKLAATLEQLSHAGFGDFYRGDVAVEIAADLEEAGAPVTRADLEKQEARLVAPLALALPGVDLFNLPPPTQGIASLIILGLFDRLKVPRGESFEHLHGLIEAAKRAYIVRDRHVTDPAYGGGVREYLEKSWLDDEADRIDRRRAAAPPPAGETGDTVWLGAIDKNGLAVSFIQSIYWEFGSGVFLPRTGILWQNRGMSFSLDPASLNPLSPGRKPFHTLNPPLARFRDGRTITYGSMGGDGQPQFQAAIFTRHVAFGMEPGDAIDAPRWRFGRTWGEDTGELPMEDGFDPDLVRALQRAGHPARMIGYRYSDGMGHAGMIVRRADGRFLGASDPRSDGAAVAV